MERKNLSEQLAKMPAEELVAVLHDVFAINVPFPEEAAFFRSRFYLGIAHSNRLSEPGTAEEWEPWQTGAVAYVNPAEYGDSLGPDYGLCQFGACMECGIAVWSNVKGGLCPVCGVAVWMTRPQVLNQLLLQTEAASSV